MACLAGPAAGNDLFDSETSWPATGPRGEAPRSMPTGASTPWLQMLARQYAANDDVEVAAGPSGSTPSIGAAGDTEEERWSDFLPLWGKELREQGFELPRPFGVSILGAGLWQDMVQDNLKLSFDAAVPPVALDIVHFSPADNRDAAVGVRLDAFILPFFNVYLMGGFNSGQVEFDIAVDPNIIVPEGLMFTHEEDYDAGFVGGGGTIALGWKQLFWMADGNATWADVNTANSTILAVTFSTRAGWRGSFEKVALSAWVGTMYMNYTQTVETSVPLLGDTLFVEIDIKSKDPWNMLLGGQLEIGKSWALMIEGGFIGRSQVTGQATFRF